MVSTVSDALFSLFWRQNVEYFSLGLGVPFSAAVPNSIQAEMGNDARKNKTSKQKSILDCADLDKQKPHNYSPAHTDR